MLERLVDGNRHGRAEGYEENDTPILIGLMTDAPHVGILTVKGGTRDWALATWRSLRGQRRHRPVHVPRPVRHGRQALGSMPKLPAPPLPKSLQPKPKRPGDENGKTDYPLPVEAGVSVVDWLDERTALSPGLRWLIWRKVPRGINWAYTLGSATLFAFLSQAVTGVFLAMYYRPDAASGAYESIRNINDNVFLGQFVHGMHKWGASVMIILIFLHMGRVFFYGAYKYPAS